MNYSANAGSIKRKDGGQDPSPFRPYIRPKVLTLSSASKLVVFAPMEILVAAAEGRILLMTKLPPNFKLILSRSEEGDDEVEPERYPPANMVKVGPAQCAQILSEQSAKLTHSKWVGQVNEDALQAWWGPESYDREGRNQSWSKRPGPWGFWRLRHGQEDSLRVRMSDILIQETQAWSMRPDFFPIEGVERLPHISIRLTQLEEAAQRFWGNPHVIPGEPSTHPIRRTIESWLESKGWSESAAKAGASIIRPAWTPDGRRPKSLSRQR